MSEGKGQRKWPIPAGFVWSHNNDCYKHPDGRHWNPDTNEFWDPKTREYSKADSRDTKGGAPRVTPADIEAAIKHEEFLLNGTLTICILTLQNGFRVTGESACAAPENFDASKGRELASKAAREKIWPLLGYVLREKLSKE